MEHARHCRRRKLYERWLKLPPRKSPEWYGLMGAIVKAMGTGIISIQVQNPKFEGFNYYTKTLVTNYIKTAGQEPLLNFMQFMLKGGRCSHTYGLGVVFRQLQPYILPWVRIAKHKLAPEFKYFIEEAGHTNRTRDLNFKQIRVYPYINLSGDDYYTRREFVTICHLTPNHMKRFKKSGHMTIGTDKLYLKDKWEDLNRKLTSPKSSYSIKRYIYIGKIPNGKSIICSSNSLAYNIAVWKRTNALVKLVGDYRDYEETIGAIRSLPLPPLFQPSRSIDQQPIEIREMK